MRQQALKSCLQANFRPRNRALGDGLQSLRQVQVEIDLLIEWPAKSRGDCPPHLLRTIDPLAWKPVSVKHITI